MASNRFSVLTKILGWFSQWVRQQIKLRKQSNPFCHQFLFVFFFLGWDFFVGSFIKASPGGFLNQEWDTSDGSSARRWSWLLFVSTISEFSCYLRFGVCFISFSANDWKLIRNYAIIISDLLMGNVSQLCNTSNIEYAANESLQTTILHNRKQSKQLPMVPTHILQQITRLLQKQAPQHLHTKIWEVHKPQHFYYFNESAYQDEAPLGLCTMYFFHPNNQFKGFFRGLIASSGLRENKGSVYVLGNGDYFIGDLHKTDYGTYISESDQYRYEGDWVCGKAHGLGVEVTKKGTYEGYFLEGNKHGKGKFHNQEGMTYEGEFRNNEMQGNGKYTNKAQNYEYIGSFKSGLRSGHGVQRCQQYEYEGTFINNCKSGSGKITYFDRKMEYEGEFQKNMPHGMGKIKFEDQTIEGVWVEGILKALFSTKQ